MPDDRSLPVAPAQGSMTEKIQDLAAAAWRQGFTFLHVKSLLEREYLRVGLTRAGGNQCALAAEIRVHRNTLARKMARVGVSVPEHWKKRRSAR
jgi:DNA-binding NtrC family response regulator